jgi:Domain of unknown function (DUF4180)
MTDKLTRMHGVPVFVCAADGAKLRTDRDALDLVADVIHHGAEMILVPVERLDDGFFQLRTGVAGEIIQKFMNYRLRVVILGNISRHVDGSPTFRSFVYESNRGAHVWFMPNVDELNQRLELAA